MSKGTFNKVNIIEWDTELFNVKSFLINKIFGCVLGLRLS